MTYVSFTYIKVPHEYMRELPSEYSKVNSELLYSEDITILREQDDCFMYKTTQTTM